MLQGKRIWIDLEHQKAAVMLKPLIDMFYINNVDLFITARDMGNNWEVIRELGLRPEWIGKHGGAILAGKLAASIERMKGLLPAVGNFKPDLVLTFSSVEAIRIAFGLGVPSVSFNDEPRSTAVARLTLPLASMVIVPRCVPEQLYLDLGASRARMRRYDGIDEIAWISRFKPGDHVLAGVGVEKGKYVVIRTEMTHASYLSSTMRPEESRIIDFLPQLVKACPGYKFIVIPRIDTQFEHLRHQFVHLNNVVVTNYVACLQDVMFYSALVMSGGGTIARESALMGVPTIEFFPGETAPQEHFLIDNGFPLWHVRDPVEIAAKAIEILSTSRQFDAGFKARLKEHEDPATVCHEEITKQLTGVKK